VIAHLTIILHCILHSSFLEFIVVFNGYYPSSTREKYVEAALLSSGILSWNIIPRNNPASNYPSDFSLILVSSCTNIKEVFDSQ